MNTCSRLARLSALVLCTLATTACGGSSSTPTAPTTPTTVTTSTADATGDATASGGGTAWDLTNVTTSRATTGAISLNVSITFAQAISSANLPPPGTGVATPTQLGAVVLISTGTAGNTVNNLTGCVGN